MRKINMKRLAFLLVLSGAAFGSSVFATPITVTFDVTVDGQFNLVGTTVGQQSPGFTPYSQQVQLVFDTTNPDTSVTPSQKTKLTQFNDLVSFAPGHSPAVTAFNRYPRATPTSAASVKFSDSLNLNNVADGGESRFVATEEEFRSKQIQFTEKGYWYYSRTLDASFDPQSNYLFADLQFFDRDAAISSLREMQNAGTLFNYRETGYSYTRLTVGPPLVTRVLRDIVGVELRGFGVISSIDVGVQQVPAPGPLLLMALGLVLMFAVQVKRQRGRQEVQIARLA